MIGALALLGVLAGVSSVVGAGAARLGFSRGKKVGAHQAREDANLELGRLEQERLGADRRAREAARELARWGEVSLASQALTTRAVYRERPAPRDAEELARLVRGLTFVDDVVVADRSGHPLTREAGRASADLAALGARVTGACRRLALEGLPTLALSLETFGATHVHARPLTGRGEGAMLLVRTTSQRVNPLVVDAAAQAAARDRTEAPSDLPVPPALAGHTDRTDLEDSPLSEVAPLLDREIAAGLSAVTLVLDGRPVLSAASDGPSVHARAVAAAALSELAGRGARVLRGPGMARVEATVRGGSTIVWSAVGPGSRLAVVTFARGDAHSPARLDRMLGTLRRAVERTSGSLLVEGWLS